MNNTVVRPAPTHTSLQAIFASGRYLKIIAKRAVMMIRFNRRLMITETVVPPGNIWFSVWLNPLIIAVTVNDTSSMKHTPPTIANETKRAFK